MATIKSFEDIEAWQLARKLCKKIHEIFEAKKDFKDFGLKTQMYNSSGSIMDNIAEGFERNGKNEFRQFLSIAKGSAGELRSQNYRLLDKNVIIEIEFNEIKLDIETVSKKISNLMSYLKETDYKGTKFSEPEVEYLVGKNLEH
jgi:four helix bundle protein